MGDGCLCDWGVEIEFWGGEREMRLLKRVDKEESACLYLVNALLFSLTTFFSFFAVQ